MADRNRSISCSTSITRITFADVTEVDEDGEDDDELGDDEVDADEDALIRTKTSYNAASSV